VQGAGYPESKVETDVAALQLETSLVDLELEMNATAMELETDVPQETLKQERYSAD
jgi:hypothetical protein